MSTQSSFSAINNNFGFAASHTSFSSNILSSGGSWCRELSNGETIYLSSWSGLTVANNISIRADFRTEGPGWNTSFGIGFGDDGGRFRIMGGLTTKHRSGLVDPGSGDYYQQDPELVMYLDPANLTSTVLNAANANNTMSLTYSIAAYTKTFLNPISYGTWYKLRLDALYLNTTNAAIRFSVYDSQTGALIDSLADTTQISSTTFNARAAGFFSIRPQPSDGPVYIDNFQLLAE